MKHNYPYLKDSAFLLKIDRQIVKEQYVKITCLDMNENPIQEVQGRCTSGSLNLSGSSAIRRTCNLSIIAEENENDLTNLDNLFSINKRIEVEIGFLNTTKYYSKFDIIWFPLGIYVIKTPSLTHNTTSVEISLTLEDKMCLLNGTMGGKFPATVEFSRMENEFGEISYPTMYQIILEVVHHFGGEQLSKIIINDLDDMVMVPKRWMPMEDVLVNGEQIEDIWIENKDVLDDESKALSYYFIEPPNVNNYTRYQPGDWIGFTYEPFTYPGCETGDENKQLVGNAGESVCTILDKIKNVLGNFEYFYDINGNFVFQEIKNYLNTSQSTVVVDKDGTVSNNYSMDISKGKSVYSFMDNMLVTNLSNNPQFEMIKNDYVVWGARDSESGEKVPFRYHLAIDDKPKVNNYYVVFPFREIDENGDISDVKRLYPIDIDFTQKTFEEFITEANKIFLADMNIQNALKNEIICLDPDFSVEDNKSPLFVLNTSDWRTELYIQGALSDRSGTASNYYYPELKNEWGKQFYLTKATKENGETKEIIELDYFTDKFQPKVLEDPSQMDFFLDFVNINTKAGELSVSNIGRKSEILNGENQGVNCMFEPTLPDIIFIPKGGDNRGYPYIEDTVLQEGIGHTEAGWNFSNGIDNDTSYVLDGYSDDITLLDNLATVYSLNSAFFNVRDLLYQYTNYNEAITLQTIPIYYLEPNTRITVKDKATGINGDFMIGTISIPFDIGSTMSITAQKVLEKI